jgi:phosphoenolpyruvate-protein phosphotransferase (PTS system enzyme I)
MDKNKETKIKGISASPGIAIGEAFIIGGEDILVNPKKITVDKIPQEILRFEEALIQTRKDLLRLKKGIDSNLGQSHAQIFDAHLLVLEDRVLIEDVIELIKKKKVNIEYAFQQVAKKYINTLAKLNDKYLKERAADVEDVSRRVLKKLLKKEEKGPLKIKKKSIIAAHDLSPIDTASLPKNNILGFATDIGGRTSHSAIIARALGIPAVVGLGDLTEKISIDTKMILDGTAGIIIINPSSERVKEYKQKQREEHDAKKIFQSLRRLSPETLDGRRITLGANIELPEEIPVALEWGAEGIGLYRTEYIFLGKDDLPNEEEQYKAYSRVAKKIKPASVILRTLDLGGDKFLSRPDIPKDMHPFLGWRAIRFCLARPDIFKTQLRAILRASINGDLKIMFPMISGVDELRQAKYILEECKKELRTEGIKFDENIQVGVMIEIPSAALLSDILAKESDFFSIGTNDLIQYALAVDRGNEKVASLYKPGHPAVLRLIKTVIDNGHKENIWVGMCGEMASEPVFAFLLLGMGLDEFSVSPPVIPKVKKLIREVRYSDAQDAAKQVLKFSSPEEVTKYTESLLNKKLKKSYKDIS